MGGKARIDRGLIASLRESSRPLRPDASLTTPSTLGADELATWKRLQTVVEELIRSLERLEERVRPPDGSRLAETAPPGHILFVPTGSGYAVVERDGPPPRPGDEVVLDGSAYRAHSHRRSPFPGDRRSCVIVEVAESERPVGLSRVATSGR